MLVGNPFQTESASLTLAEDAGPHAMAADDFAAEQAEEEVFERVWERAAAAGARLPQNDFPRFNGLGHLGALSRFEQSFQLLH